MKKHKRIGLLALLVFFIGVPLLFADMDKQMQTADELFEKGNLDNYERAVDIYMEIVSEYPDNFEANWKAARALREYGEEHLRMKVEGYEDICSEYGEKGMKYAEKAIDLEPERVEGYLYYGMNVGTYSEGVGTFRALREGLKGKTQSSLEKAYEIDPHFAGGAPIYVLGRFWQVVPWPYTDRDKAQSLYREFQETRYYENNVESRIFLAEILIRKGGTESKKEAEKLLEEALELEAHDHWHFMAKDLLDDL